MSNQLSLPYGEVALSSFAFQYTTQNKFPAFGAWSSKHLIIKTPSFLLLLFFPNTKKMHSKFKAKDGVSRA